VTNEVRLGRPPKRSGPVQEPSRDVNPRRLIDQDHLAGRPIEDQLGQEWCEGVMGRKDIRDAPQIMVAKVIPVFDTEPARSRVSGRAPGNDAGECQFHQGAIRSSVPETHMIPGP